MVDSSCLAIPSYPRTQFERHGVGDDGQCNITCAGDPDTTCGGYYAFDLYQLEWAEAPTSEEYVGCFADSKHDRVMFNMMVSQNMTETVCRDHCVNIPGTLYYATQVLQYVPPTGIREGVAQ